jgi:hypothetical protein
VLVFPATFAYWRVTTGAFDISATDVFTVLALVAAVPFVPWRNKQLRRLFAALGAYLALLAVVVLANPTAKAFAEWPHRVLLFGGAVAIGAAAAHRRRVTTALRVFVMVATVVAFAAIADSLSSGLQPAYPFGMEKNAVGPLFAIGAILLIIVPERFRFSRPVTNALLVLMLLGLTASQSRGAALGFVAVLALHATRRTRGQRRRFSALALVASVVLVFLSVTALQNEQAVNAQFSGITTRQEAYRYALNSVWAAHPIAGGA